ncbi:MAG: alpha/beta hydrolase [Bacteroidia bacterium]
MKTKKYFLLISAIVLLKFSFGQAPATLKNESPLILETKTGKIYGSVVVPPSKKPIAVALIIAGSGPTDRNGNNYAGLKTDAYKMIAEELRKDGIASLRYDKRMIGESADTSVKEIDLRFDTYVDDAIEWIKLLKSDKRFSKVIVIGHSEGSLIGMIAAEKANADGYISLAGCGTSADKILKEQLKASSQAVADISFPIIDSLVAGKLVEKVNPLLLSVFRPSIQPYLISWFKYDPAKEIAKLKIPVSIIQGTTDVQVKEKEAQLLFAAKPDATLHIIKNMNHVLKECDGDVMKSTATYSDPKLPLKPELVKALKEYFKALK